MSTCRKRKDPNQGDLFRSKLGKTAGHGGARRGAGRPRKQGRRKVAHRRRQRFSSPRPLHVTVRLVRQLRSLRKRKKCKVLHDVFCKTRRKGFRLCHFSVQDDHIHLIVEAANRAAMTAGMHSVNSRIGCQMNAAFGRKRGRVIADRYHERPLNSPRQVRNTLAYVLNNGRRHVWKETRETCKRDWLDPCSSSEFFDGWRGVEDPVPISANAPRLKDLLSFNACALQSQRARPTPHDDGVDKSEHAKLGDSRRQFLGDQWQEPPHTRRRHSHVDSRGDSGFYLGASRLCSLLPSPHHLATKQGQHTLAHTGTRVRWLSLRA